MALLPNRQKAILKLRKIENYCLNPNHPRGRHKARVFRNSLNIDRQDAQWLREILLAAAGEHDAVELGADALGRRWRIDIPVTRQNKKAVVRTIWIVRTGEDTPRFVTCWVV
jgi:hypothetical protein